MSQGTTKIPALQFGKTKDEILDIAGGLIIMCISAKICCAACKRIYEHASNLTAKVYKSYLNKLKNYAYSNTIKPFVITTLKRIQSLMI